MSLHCCGYGSAAW